MGPQAPGAGADAPGPTRGPGAPPLSAPTPAAGLVTAVTDGLASIGARIIATLERLGGGALFFGRTLWVGPRRPWGVYDISYQMISHGLRSLPITSVLSLFIGMILAWQFGEALTDFGAKMALGYVTSLALVRELVPSVLALTVGTKMAAGMTAELGSMKVTEQIDAIAALGADPIKKLVWPRVVAATLGLPMLVVFGNALALVGGMLIANIVFDIPPEYFYQSYVDELNLIDYVSSVTKGLVFGGVVGVIGCYQGFETRYGTEAVGIATTDTIVATSLTILVADFLLTMMFLPI